jgi:hypothetical protein
VLSPMIDVCTTPTQQIDTNTNRIFEPQATRLSHQDRKGLPRSLMMQFLSRIFVVGYHLHLRDPANSQHRHLKLIRGHGKERAGMPKGSIERYVASASCGKALSEHAFRGTATGRVQYCFGDRSTVRQASASWRTTGIGRC